MPETNNQSNNPLNLAEGTTKHKIYQKFFVEQITNIQQISNDLNLSPNTIKTQLYLIKRLMQNQNGSADLSSPAPSVSNANQVLEVSVKTENDRVYLYVKACQEFENWLIANKEVKTTTNLWGNNEEGKYYYLRVARTGLDDINMPIIVRGEFNFAVLRNVGISQGKRFELNNLISEEQIVLGLKKFIKVYKDFFKLEIKKTTININAEVLDEQ